MSETTREQIRSVDDLIKSEVNIKSVEYLDDASGVLSKKVKPNFKALGPKFGPRMKEVAALITAMTNDDIAILEKENQYNPANTDIIITPELVEILTEDLPGYLSAKDNELTVALDITITEALRQEGIAREFVNRVQNFRKDSGFEVTDKIKIELLNTNTEVSAGVLAYQDYIAQEVQAISLEVVDALVTSVEVEMEEVTLNWNIVVA